MLRSMIAAKYSRKRVVMKADAVLKSLCENSSLEYDLPSARANWMSVGELLKNWEQILSAYQNYLGTRTIEPAAACAAQHYSGRWVPVILALWWKTGKILDCSHGIWFADIDERGATLSVRCSKPRFISFGDEGELLSTLVEHLRDIANFSLTQSRLISDVVWGSMAASLAGGLSTIVRSHKVQDRDFAIDKAIRLLRTKSPLTYGKHGWLIDPYVVEGSDGKRLAFLRTTCCLIHLGHYRCEQCPNRPEAERAESSKKYELQASRTIPIK